MSIEIRQLLIKSNVVQRCATGGEGDGDSDEQRAEMHEDILVQCRELVLDILAQRGER